MSITSHTISATEVETGDVIETARGTSGFVPMNVSGVLSGPQGEAYINIADAVWEPMGCKVYGPGACVNVYRGECDTCGKRATWCAH